VRTIKWLIWNGLKSRTQFCSIVPGNVDTEKKIRRKRISQSGLSTRLINLTTLSCLTGADDWSIRTSLIIVCCLTWVNDWYNNCDHCDLCPTVYIISIIILKKNQPRSPAVIQLYVRRHSSILKLSGQVKKAYLSRESANFTSWG